MMLSQEQQEQIYKSLKSIVNDFNKNLHDWMEDTGCRVNFGFSYGLDRDVKSIDILGIDLIVWRKQPPGSGVLKSLTLGEVLNGNSSASASGGASKGDTEDQSRAGESKEELRDPGGVHTDTGHSC
jgi:hypothetical protein